MKPLNLQEFAEELRRKGDWREAEFADEILDLLSITNELEEPYSELLGALEDSVPAERKNFPAIQHVEWLTDRSNLLEAIEDKLCEAKRDGDADDEVKDILETLDTVETIMEQHGGWTTGDLADGLFALIERAGHLENDLEYDL